MIFSLAGKPKTKDALSFYLLGANANVIKNPLIECRFFSKPGDRALLLIIVFGSYQGLPETYSPNICSCSTRGFIASSPLLNIE